MSHAKEKGLYCTMRLELGFRVRSITQLCCPLLVVGQHYNNTLLKLSLKTEKRGTLNPEISKPDLSAFNSGVFM